MHMLSVAAATVVRDDLITEASLYAVEYFIIYIFCLIGAFIKDAIVAHKYKAKIDFVDIALYPILCTFIVSAVYEVINLKYDISIGIVAFFAMCAGVWSRELVALLTNNKVVLAIFKIFAKYTANKFGKDLSEKQQKELYEALQSGMAEAMNEGSDNPENELSTPNEGDPIGEFEWTSILKE